MDEKPKSIWRKSFTGRTALVVWLAVAVFTVMLGSFIIALLNPSRTMSDWLLGVGVFMGAFLVLCLFIIYIAWPLLRWLFWKHWRRSLFALACFATLIALFYAEENLRGWHTWNQFKTEWEAKGEHFDMASVTPALMPEEQNFALTPIAFTGYGYILTRDGKRIPYEQRDTNFISRINMEITHRQTDAPPDAVGLREKGKFTNLEAWQSYYRDLATKTNAFPAPAQPQSPAADVLLALSKHNPTIDELRVASRLPGSRFPLEYTNDSPAAILLPHLAPLKNCARLLQLRSSAELQNGQSDKALDDVRLGVQLTDKIRTEPFLISHLVRIAMLQLMFQTVWEGLAEHKWSEAQLAAIEADLVKLDFPADYKLSMRGELGMQSGEIEHLRRHPRQLNDLGGGYEEEGNGGSPSLPEGLIAQLIPSGWFYQNQFRCARVMVEYFIPVADVAEGTFSPDLVRRGNAAVNSELKSFSPYTLLGRLMLPALGNAAKKFARGQSSVDLARTAIALERYRLAHGEYPESLDALAPQFIAKVPHDVIGGQPLKYRREANGQFVLYSVGWNEKDDGGMVVFKKGSSPDVDINQGDWVWRYPVK